MKEKDEVGVFLSNEDSKVPTTAYEYDVGYDLYSTEDYEVAPGQLVEVNTGVHLALPEHMYAQINTRSSFGKKGLYVHHGVIDSGYTGPVTVWVMNIATPHDNRAREPYIIHKGDRIAQILFHKATRPKLNVIEQLPETERGQKGYGSSGK